MASLSTLAGLPERRRTPVAPDPALIAAAALLLACWATEGLTWGLLALPPACVALGVLAWHATRGAALAAWAAASLSMAFATWPVDLTLANLERPLAAVLLLGGAAIVAHRLAAHQRALQQELAHLGHTALSDRLTDLPNRLLLLDRLAMALAHARRSHGAVAVLALDLDGFKAVNDQHGHAAGDEVLKAVARRLKACVRASDTVARLGGDEFAVVLSHLEDPADAARVPRKVLDAVGEPIEAPDGRVHRVGVSIGISAYPRDGTEIDRLLMRADAALYDSKRRGKNTISMHESQGAQREGSAWLNSPTGTAWACPRSIGSTSTWSCCATS